MRLAARSASTDKLQCSVCGMRVAHKRPKWRKPHVPWVCVTAQPFPRIAKWLVARRPSWGKSPRSQMLSCTSTAKDEVGGSTRYAHSSRSRDTCKWRFEQGFVYGVGKYAVVLSICTRWIECYLYRTLSATCSGLSSGNTKSLSVSESGENMIMYIVTRIRLQKVTTRRRLLSLGCIRLR